ncbi:MAG: hypothetical protein A4E49_01507 [Methanosaeta sp. PtaU1.Bin112]|nr:MAG: hypothetical protein A4E49_01507 [Methanosaeta sp. PtaU1.Bin112]
MNRTMGPMTRAGAAQTDGNEERFEVTPKNMVWSQSMHSFQNKDADTIRGFVKTKKRRAVQLHRTSSSGLWHDYLRN